jgi:hypothetical protein
MLKLAGFILLIINALNGFGQPNNMAGIKSEIEKSPNSPLYVKDILKKFDWIRSCYGYRLTVYRTAWLMRGVKKVCALTMQGQNSLSNAACQTHKIGRIFIDIRVQIPCCGSIGNSSQQIKSQDGLRTWPRPIQWANLHRGDLGWVARAASFRPVINSLPGPKRAMYLWSGQQMVSISSN